MLRVLDMDAEDIKYLPKHCFDALINYELSLHQIVEMQDTLRKARKLYEHYLELSKGDVEIAQNFFLETQYSSWLKDIIEGSELENADLKKWYTEPEEKVSKEAIVNDCLHKRPRK